MYRLYYYDERVPYPVLYILGKLGVLLAANTYVFQCILGVLGAGGRAHAPRSAEAAAPRGRSVALGMGGLLVGEGGR